MHIHSAWYVLLGISPDDIVGGGAPAFGMGEIVEPWTRVEAGHMLLWRSWVENEALDAVWTSTREDFTLAAYVLDSPRFIEALGGSVVGAASPLPSANLNLVERWMGTQAASAEESDNLLGRPVEIRTGFHGERSLEAEVVAVRYDDQLGRHVVDLRGPRSLAEAVLDVQEPLTGATLRIGQGIVNVFNDNQIFLGDVPPYRVPGLVTAVGLALWEPVR
jgi:hypothetical protein